ncbi:bifunctional DNA-formamidopyrimidine glycosylase/DNA-(apurinic or apyrimidinic site) lyase [Devosia neptuniae]|jgi:formamidopyrimidine-DNA glycosylase|uniref:bifunctional DNA-formamidopyrimidine glycosylase/DNA-(apurinic or apyrimidinic site) lyase n=1 Tax=Devosia TaxID=46913 RepID=UPI0022AFCFC2|nr:bifunctional DNA-formamidopyrimidine glycosylase/DNA-(apurinic or apyrimidinic site) lyase [Devosia neptuniae]MCZ4347800.1 bifunctional DNA-formamidopyrimidine glycosylase/DNA-(apurinic or apyrimidinic site) lyase [Devosia neptuniae]|tara:strand:- start:12586 stop:13473 length:888 start_codon:yes stop_codon:yes gene_type:complete
MPELPEVETVRRGLQPWLEGARIDHVTLNRPNLRFPFPRNLAQGLEGSAIVSVGRRAKYLLITLSNGKTILSHLGMTGSWRFAEHGIDKPPRYYETATPPRHDHLVLDLDHPEHGKSHLIYADPRRFGFVDLYDDIATSPYLAGLGPEPLGNDFNAAAMAEKFAGKKTPIKAALLDQRVVAGLGNIYVAEALHRAHILPTVLAGTLVTTRGKPKPALEDLAGAVRTVLLEAIASGGSTLRDFRNAEGGNGYFQHNFAVYDREGDACATPGCAGIVQRIVQSGRSTFFCPMCQKKP